MAKVKKSVSQIVTQLAEPIAQSLGLSLWDVKFLKEGGNWYLRVFIDKEGGVTLDDCENMSRKLDEPLDVLDPIDVSYCLEVCSPGIERELSCDAHLGRFIGSEVNLQLFAPNENGDKNFSGILKNFNNDAVQIDIDGKISEISRKGISKINLKI